MGSKLRVHNPLGADDFFARKAANELRELYEKSLQDGIVSPSEKKSLETQHAILGIAVKNAKNPMLPAETSPLFSQDLSRSTMFEMDKNLHSISPPGHSKYARPGFEQIASAFAHGMNHAVGMSTREQALDNRVDRALARMGELPLTDLEKGRFHTKLNEGFAAHLSERALNDPDEIGFTPASTSSPNWVPTRSIRGGDTFVSATV
ncbi:hypothetical protein [Ruegeria atlantica]|uniref:hypothetical protein n=1 Tax=Ruegeria atlantica TaxID=81569 RepID=UPI00147DBF56|nr:hypothetical protein [Ruegeria atlantica]